MAVEAQFEGNWVSGGAHDSNGSGILSCDVCNLTQTSITYAENIGYVEITACGQTEMLNVVILMNGALTVCFNEDVLHTLAPGNAACLPNHAGMKIKIHPGSRWINFTIPINALRKTFEEWTQKPLPRELYVPYFYTFSKNTVLELGQTFQQACNEVRNAQRAERKALADVYERLLLIKLFASRSDGEDIDAGLPPSVERAETFMRANLCNPITIHDVATAARCSPRTLQRLFMKYRGTHPMNTFRYQRLSAAYEAIMRGELYSTAAIAGRFRFSSVSRFSALFREAYGTTPSEMIRFYRTRN
ncbi:helix-turn-helix transcriptional regulator [Phyllobacterium sp. 628]|uniref:helix-turn-helix domain-containing protein n=1 Tax=Phyllobacterium sp. 628 TaxID=2718938 RepID=UPI0016625FE4|nr:AraC family transcriptional regulator [Phyllobacterium sp. 628]QND52649.1 helix-turn-helix transcriptional regulator [Phyllobacterium sp. 628]